MDTTVITKSIKKLSQTIDNNSPVILSALAIAGVVSTVIMAVKATPKAMLVINNAEMEKIIESEDQDIDFVPLTPLEMAEACWQLYLPTAIMGTLTIGCIVMSNHISLRRNAALASLLTIAESAAREYQEKVVETIGERKEEKLREEIIQKHLDENPTSERTIIITGNGDYLCFDEFSKRYFRSNIDKVQRAANEYNQRLLIDGYLSVNYFYDLLGLEEVELFQEFGWIGERGLLELKTSSKVATVDGNKEPCMVFNYHVTPHHI